MPRVIIPNTHIEETFLRPIVLKIVNDIKDITGMDDKYITNPAKRIAAHPNKISFAWVFFLKKEYKVIKNR